MFRASVAIAAVTVVLAVSPTATAATGHSTLRIPCGATGVQAPADWYLPPRPAVGIVMLVHGWSGTKASVAGLAEAVASRTGAIVVAPTLSSNMLATGGCWILGAPLERAVADLFVGDRAALRESARAAGIPGALPRPFVLAGHSAGGHLALAAAGYITGTDGFADLRAVIPLDGGSGSAPSHAAAALEALSGQNWKPIFTIASPEGEAPPGGFTEQIVAARPGRFVGVRVTNGCHLDATADRVWSLLLTGCWLRTENIDAYRTILSEWVSCVFSGEDPRFASAAPGDVLNVGRASVTIL